MDGTCKEDQLLSLVFYQAVRDHKPVWMLEDMRTMETFHWEASARQQTYTPSEALLYAIVHDHRVYARHLLNHYSDHALALPGKSFCCGPESAPHLSVAVRYDRRDILALILQVAHRSPGLSSYVNRAGCYHSEDGKTPLHLACELSHHQSVVTLLGNGASPQAEDHNGMTPLDLVLQQLRNTETNGDAQKLCLESLLMFTPKLRFKLKGSLERDPQSWSRVLGEDTFRYLVGKKPAPLGLMAMRRVLTRLDPQEFPQNLDKLPIPVSLKELTGPF